MRALSFLITALSLSLVTVSAPTARAADKKEKAKPVPAKPPAAKPPADAKPPATPAKPADTKPPATPAKPADTKPPATPAKPADTKPPATPVKPADTKPPATPTPPAAQPSKPAEPEPAPAAASFDIETLRKDRGERRTASIARSRQLWGALLANDQGAAELKRHSFLIAALQRIRAIAEGKKDNPSVETVNALLVKEEERHNRAMNSLRAVVGVVQ